MKSINKRLEVLETLLITKQKSVNKKKSRLRGTLNLSTDEESSTDNKQKFDITKKIRRGSTFFYLIVFFPHHFFNQKLVF